MKLGTKVRMSQELMDLLYLNGSVEHLNEFCDEVGVIVPKDPDIEHWPEVNVEWGDTGLRYLYPPAMLEEIK